MYYKEALIDGKMMYKTVPNGQWSEFTVEMYRERLMRVMYESSLKD